MLGQRLGSCARTGGRSAPLGLCAKTGARVVC